MALSRKYKILISTVVILAIIGSFYMFFLQVRYVKAGEIGVKASLTGTDIHPVRGYVIFMPLYTDFVTYPTTVQIVSYDSIAITSKDGISFHIRPSISYQLNEAKIIDLYKASRSSLDALSKGYLKELVAASYSAVANNFTADSLAVNEQQFKESANKILTAKMEETGLVLKNTIPNLEYPESIKAAIALRVKTLQEALIAENRLRQVDALRKEDSLRFSALTPLAIQKMFIEKWDGKMSAYGNEVSRIYDSIVKK